jgi:large subunit ribosomal protein L19
LHSPKIDKIDVAAIGDVNRAKLYYLRGKVGRKARVRELRQDGTRAAARSRPATEVAQAPDAEAQADSVAEAPTDITSE